jgi:DNA repair exonuclease SbcCD ATPase subunit
MYNPLTIRFRNLFSHKETEYSFDNGRITLIHGENLDVKGSNSNGGGKSTVIEAIYLAIHGECYRDVDKMNFISKWADECEILFALHSYTQKENLLIKRTFHRKKTSKVLIEINQEPQDQLTSVAEANAFIFEKLGISKEDLGNHYVISQGNNSSFFTSTDAHQKEIIGRFANFAAIDSILDNIRLRYKVLDKEVQILDGDIYAKEAVIENLHEMLIDAKSAADNSVSAYKELVKETQEAYKQRKSQLKELKAEATEEVDSLVKLQAQFEAGQAKLEDGLLLVGELASSKEVLRTYRAELDKLCQRESKLNTLLGGSIECPKCGEEFIPGKDLDALRAELAVNKQAQTKLEGKITKRKAKLREQQAAVEVHEELEAEVSDLGRQVTRTQRSVDTAQDRVTKANRELVKYEKQLDQLKATPPVKQNDKAVQKLQKQVGDAKILATELKAAKAALQTERQDLQFWELHFGTKGFKTHLANQTIGVIEKLVNHSLSKLYTDLQARLKGFTVLKNGDLRDKITIDIIGADGTAGPFARHSGGEQARVKVAGILALHQLSNMNTNGRGLNLLCLDENFEGLDTQGQLEVLALLAAHKVTTLIITHHRPEFLPTAYNKVVVRKQAGVSTLKRHVTPAFTG